MMTPEQSFNAIYYATCLDNIIQVNMKKKVNYVKKNVANSFNFFLSNISFFQVFIYFLKYFLANIIQDIA